MAGPKPRQSRDAATMSKTTTIKIPMRIITTHLPFLDTTMTTESASLYFGEASIYFGEPRGDEVPHRERRGTAAEQQLNRRFLTFTNGVDAHSFRLDTDPPEALKYTGSSLERLVGPPTAFQRDGAVPAGVTEPCLQPKLVARGCASSTM